MATVRKDGKDVDQKETQRANDSLVGPSNDGLTFEQLAQAQNKARKARAERLKGMAPATTDERRKAVARARAAHLAMQATGSMVGAETPPVAPPVAPPVPVATTAKAGKAAKAETPPAEAAKNPWEK